MKVGVDLVTISRFCLEESWVERILSKDEIKDLSFWSIANNERKREILASRWACKEAIKKITNTKIPFSKIRIQKTDMNALIYKEEGKNNTINLTLSHENDRCIAIAYMD